MPKGNQSIDQHLKPGVVAARLGVHISTVYRLIEEGHLPSVKLGARMVRIPERALVEYLKRKSRKAK